jgi:transposase
MLAARGLEGLHAPWVIDGAVHGAILRCWVRDVRGPPLHAGEVVRWDNLAAHKVAGIEELLTACGAQLLRLSPYAPDFHPIEPCWAKSKTFLRQAKARTVDVLIDAIKHALDTVTATDIRGWFAHCGYTVH